MTVIGVLAIQGDFLEHRKMLDNIQVESKEIRLPGQLESIDGLIIPGGESTTIAQLIDIYKLRDPLKEKASYGLPIWGTCAGMIVMAKTLTDARPVPLGLIDVEVTRNAFGRQVDSFEADLHITGIDGPPFRGIFIRAPIVKEIGENTTILANLSDGTPVAVQEKRLLGTAFHPELTDDTRVHQFFTDLVETYY